MLLIDGHNLIGKLPDISLSDPDDEAKLVRVLENYHAMHPHEAILVVFDPSREGGAHWSNTSRHSAGVNVRFAPPGHSADAIIARIVRDDKNRRSITVVSSDNAVRKSAREHGAKSLTAEEFILKLRAHANPRKRKPADAPPPEAAEKPQSSDAEYWAQFFPEPKPKPARKPAAPAQKPAASAAKQPSAESEDIAYWLKIFGERQANESADEAAPQEKKPRSNESGVEYWLREFSKKR